MSSIENPSLLGKGMLFYIPTAIANTANMGEKH
jgi:hypothetical protein